MNKGVFFRIAVKRQAKVTFFKNLIKCIGIAFIFLFILFSLFLFQFPIAELIKKTDNPYIQIALQFLPDVLNLLILSPVALGFLEYCMRLADKKPVSAGDIFLWFGEGKRYIKAVFICILFYLPIYAFSYFILFGILSSSYVVMSIITVILVFTGAKLCTYLPGMFLLAEDPLKKPWECVRESGRLFKQRKWDLFLFLLSFFGWFLMIVMIASSAMGMEITESGVAITMINGIPDLLSIPAPIMLRAAAYGVLMSGVLMLYVVPYMALATSYYIKGTLNPDLFRKSIPGWGP